MLSDSPNSQSRPPRVDPGALRALGELLPRSIAVSDLFERSIRVTNEDGVFTLTEGARVWLLVGVNKQAGVHRLDGLEIRAAASQRPQGPVMIGTPEIQWLLDVGEHAYVGSYVLYVVSRGPSGVTYAIVDEELWRD